MPAFAKVVSLCRLKARSEKLNSDLAFRSRPTSDSFCWSPTAGFNEPQIVLGGTGQSLDRLTFVNGLNAPFSAAEFASPADLALFDDNDRLHPGSARHELLPSGQPRKLPW